MSASRRRARLGGMGTTKRITSGNLFGALRALRQRGLVSVYRADVEQTERVRVRLVGELRVCAAQVEFLEGVELDSEARTAHTSSVEALASEDGLDHVRVYVRDGAGLSRGEARWLATLIRRADRLAQRRAAMG